MRWRRRFAFTMPHPRRYGTRMNPLVVNALFINRVAMRKLRWILVLAIPLLAACGGSEPICEDPDEPYLAAGSTAPLHVPDGMTQPNHSEALAIPAEKGDAKKAGRTSCLDEPPSYFRSTGTVA